MGGYALGALLTGASGSVPTLMGSRAVSGITVGGEVPVGWAFMAEHTPPSKRGKYLGLQQACWPLGYLFAVMVVFVLAHGFFAPVQPGIDWRIAFWVGVLPALLLLWIRFGTQESATWQAQGPRRTGQAVARQLLRRAYRPGLLLASLLQITGTVVFASAMVWFPLYLVKVRHLTVAQSSGDLLLWVGAAFVGQVLSGWLSDRWGRRPVAIVFFAGQGLCFYLFTHLTTLQALAWASPFVGFFVLGVWGVISVWMNELFPTEVRAYGLGVAATIGRLASALAPLMVGALATSQGLVVGLLPFPLLALTCTVVLLVWRPHIAKDVSPSPESLASAP